MRFICALLLLAAAGRSAEIPRLEKSGGVSRLIVDGKPFIVLGGELHNSSASSLDYMRPIWGQLYGAAKLNTVLATVSWELLEPEEGKFDFTLVDGLIAGARQSQMKLVLLWFGSWKNGASTYAPLWVKRDTSRFPRAQDRSGRNMEVLSTLSTAARDADARAFAALMRHVRDADAERTVIMVQVENEVGILGESRDRSAAAEAAFRAEVPRALIAWLQQHKATLVREIAELWTGRTSGTWRDVFGDSAAAGEAFMAWQYARYIDAVAAAGKREYPLPMYVNAWLVQSEGQPPGGYPSGGPVSRVMDIWRAGAPSIDFLSPDIYLPDLPGIVASYSRSGNTLFIPEARHGDDAPKNAVYAIGQGAIGFSPFAIDDVPQGATVGAAYSLLRPIVPLLAQHAGQTRGILDHASAPKEIRLGEYVFSPSFPGESQRSGGYGLIVWLGGDEYLVTGSGFTLSVRAVDEGRTARIGFVDEGKYESDKWIPGRRLNGDEIRGESTMIVVPVSSPHPYLRVRLYQHPA